MNFKRYLIPNYNDYQYNIDGKHLYVYYSGKYDNPSYAVFLIIDGIKYKGKKLENQVNFLFNEASSHLNKWDMKVEKIPTLKANSDRITDYIPEEYIKKYAPVSKQLKFLGY